jgi:ATP-dependent Lon protease
MKESATLQWHTFGQMRKFNIDHRVFDQWDVHAHAPAGATQRRAIGWNYYADVTSAFTQHKVKLIWLTGEITLRGRYYRLVVSRRRYLLLKSQYQEIICQKSKIFWEIKEDYIRDMQFHYVSEMKEVINLALFKDKKGCNYLTVKETAGIIQIDNL